MPFPHALDQDQAANAAILARVGAATVVPQTEFTAERLAGLLRASLDEPQRMAAAAAAAKSVGVPDAAERLADEVVRLAKA